jgi:hypothetical protein
VSRGGTRPGSGRKRVVSDELRRQRLIESRRRWWRLKGSLRRKLRAAGWTEVAIRAELR